MGRNYIFKDKKKIAKMNRPMLQESVFLGSLLSSFGLIGSAPDWDLEAYELFALGKE